VAKYKVQRMYDGCVITCPAANRQYPLTISKLYCFVTEDCVNILPPVVMWH